MLESEASRRREREILRTLVVVLKNQEEIMRTLRDMSVVQASETPGIIPRAVALAKREGATKATLEILAEYVE